MRMPDPAIRLREVVKAYGRQRAIDGISLSVPEGERLGLLGHNGAGKTTLMKLVLGLVPPSAGEVRVLGDDPARARSRLAVGFLPENVAFQPAMTGWEVLRFYARLRARPRAECQALIERVGLAEAAHRRVATYSKGMRQRLGLAQALLGTPRLMLLDEPTNGLDPELRAAFYGIVEERRRAGAAVVISSHLLGELEARTERLAILDRGRLRALGTIDELRQAARLPVRVLVRACPGGGGAAAERLAGLQPQPLEADLLAIFCAPADKLGVLRAALDLGGLVEDIRIDEPSVEDVYAHFTAAEAEP